ncbi:MAG: beta-propeller fold lactonase family protein [Planctomycetota bacterium]
MTQDHLQRPSVFLGAAVVAALAASCGGADNSKNSIPGVQGSGATLRVLEVSNGFGQLIPHRVRELNSNGTPTGQVIPITSNQVIATHVRRSNPILPVPQFPETAVLPSGVPGNQFFVARFSQEIDIASVLDASPGAQGSSGLTGSVSVTSLDPLAGTALPILGRVFVGGKTYAGLPSGSPPQLELQTWVEYDEATGRLIPLVPEANNFPGVASPLANAAELVQPNAIVFVADNDGSLDTLETFPTNVAIRFRVTTALRATNGRSLTESVLASTTVGVDTLGPEVVTTPPPLNAPRITPGNGDFDVDPRSSIRIEFTEPVQPYSVGVTVNAEPPASSSSIALQFGPSSKRTTMPFAVLPASPFDLSTYDLFPAFFFPGAGPELAACGTFSRIDVTVNPGLVEDLASNPDPNNAGQSIPNTNLLGTTTFFETGEGPGIVNAPVLPDVIYVARLGALPGLSVLDLNGFGGGTGLPNDETPVIEREKSKYPFNSNVAQNLNIRPPLAVGTCTIDGGSAGVFTLTLDSALNDKVVRAPIVANIQDMHIGHGLDTLFNNASPPFGCLAQGGDPCALPGLKLISPTLAGANTLGPVQQGQFGNIQPGYENLISWAPHPNPPPLVFPPLCITPFLNGQEPSSIDNVAAGVTNLLVPGDPFGRPLQNPPAPPSGLLTTEQNAFFLGPSFAQPQNLCQPYQIRQQVGQFLYVADRPRSEIVVLNSNRMTVVDRIQVPDPTSLAMGPNLDVLGVTNQLADTVTFVDIDPSSATFHQVIKTTVVGNSPRGIAWDPLNEDVLVCNEFSNSVSVISAATLEVRKEVRSQLSRPFELCITPRQIGAYGFGRNVYYAYILNRTGSVALFESGPNGLNGWGFDDIVGVVPFTFQNPKAIQFDPLNVDASVYIVHEAPISLATGQPGNAGEGAISRLRFSAAIAGQIPLQIIGIQIPTLRDITFGVPVSVGANRLSGIPIDIAFDNQRNVGGLQAPASTFSAGSQLPSNGKHVMRPVPGGFINTSEPQFLFAAVPNPLGGSGVIDVLELGGAGLPRIDTDPYVAGIQSVPVTNVSVVSDFFRQ